MKLETIKVSNPSGEGFMIINKSDFKEDVHNLWIDNDVEYNHVVVEATDQETVQQSRRGRPPKAII